MSIAITANIEFVRSIRNHFVYPPWLSALNNSLNVFPHLDYCPPCLLDHLDSTPKKLPRSPTAIAKYAFHHANCGASSFLIYTYHATTSTAVVPFCQDHFYPCTSRASSPTATHLHSNLSPSNSFSKTRQF